MSQTNVELSGTVVLIIDASQSAAGYWGETRRVALQLYAMLSGHCEVAIRLLGHPNPVIIDNLKSLSPLAGQPCSLIAPNLMGLVQQRPIEAVMIVGNGEIFDLEDWLDHPLIDRWFLVQSGPDSLQGHVSRLPEIASSQFDKNAVILSRPLPQNGRMESSSRRIGNTKKQQWAVDQTGYPLILVEPIRSWVQFFPVTKTQFERFISTSARVGLGDEWYATILKFNPRISFRSCNPEVYERLLLTGITSDEAMAFGHWLGNEYALLEAEEWRTSYRWMIDQPAPILPVELSGQLAADARFVWKLIEDRLQPLTLLDLSLMSQGVMEWVIDRVKGHVGLGYPRASSPFPPPLREWFDPVKPIVARPRDFGFRLRRPN